MSFNDYLDLAYARKRYIKEHQLDKGDPPVLRRTAFGEWVYPDDDDEEEIIIENEKER
jgi:hypothetical protein